MSNSPLVSVVIPTYNRAAMLGESLTSVLAQSHRNLEVIVVDDDSSDDTEEVVAAIKDSRLRFVRHDANRGAPAARNTGIEHSHGEYIAFLDSDDRWEVSKIERQLQCFAESSLETALVYTGLQKVDSKGRVLAYRQPTHRGKLYRRLLTENVVGSTSTVMIKKEALQEVGGFDPELPARQDLELWLRIAKSYSIECVPDPLVVYRVHDASISADSDKRIRGSEMVLKKYWKDIRYRPHIMGTYYYGLGRMYRGNGDMHNARRYLLHPATLLIKPQALYYSLKLK